MPNRKKTPNPRTPGTPTSSGGAVPVAGEEALLKRVEALVAEGRAATLTGVEAMLKSVMGELRPSGPAPERVVPETAAAAAAAKAAAAAAAAAVEEDRLAQEARELLPVRAVDEGAPLGSSRLRGGAQRVQPREATLRRVFGGRDLADEEISRLGKLLRQGSQVSSPSASASSLFGAAGGVAGGGGVGWAAASGAASDPLLAELQQVGIAPVHGGAAYELAMKRILERELKKEDKLVQCKSYQEFVKAWRAVTTMTRATCEASTGESENYWAMVWHHQSMEYIFLEHNWAVAKAYNQLVLSRWAAGHLSPGDYTSTEVFRRGDVYGALYREAYVDARDAGRTARKATPAQRDLPTGGTLSRANQDDQWCDEHRCFFPKSMNHRWSWLRKEGTCNAAKGKLKGPPGRSD